MTTTRHRADLVFGRRRRRLPTGSAGTAASAWHDARARPASAWQDAADRDAIRASEDQPAPDRREQGTDHEAARSEDLCFLPDATPEQVVQNLRDEGVAIVTGPGRRQGALGTLMSVYCRDPDDSLIEIASYVDAQAER